MSATYARLIDAAAAELSTAGVETPARDARLLMRWAAGLDGAGLAARMPDPCPDQAATRFRDATARRAGREPLSHITGYRDFWGRAFRVTPDVLDPRPETECLVADALHRGPFANILDLGTGTGCLPVTLLAEWPQARATATDISPAALSIARQNARTHDVADRMKTIKADWLDGISGAFDLIVSNPPYLTQTEMHAISPEVGHEPALALSPGGDGLDAYRAIAAGVRDVMAPGGLLMLEIGPTQSQHVAAILAGAGLNVIAIIPDLDQRARVVVARS